MITNTGKAIIGKYLVGQTSSYASYLAIGCGAKPLSTSGTFEDYSTQTSLNFETLRVPIISKAYVVESGVSKVILTAELPSLSRYEITEIGIYPSQSNPAPTGLDSQSLYLFSTSELWQYNTSSATTTLPQNFGSITNSNNDITATDAAFFTNADNALFQNSSNTARLTRNERSRFLNDTIMVLGNTSTLTASGSNLTVGTGSNRIQLAISDLFTIQQNSVDDEIRLAFSLVNKNGIGSTDVPSNVKILVQFATTADSSAEYANFVVNLDNGTSAGQWDFANNRYVVASKKLSALTKTGGFSWSGVKYVLIYVCVNNNSTGAGNFFVSLDALRLENVSSFNSVYGLTAYTVIKTTDSLPIVKSDNSSSFIEFKYVVGVA
jgi:hypothetical protein